MYYLILPSERTQSWSGQHYLPWEQPEIALPGATCPACPVSVAGEGLGLVLESLGGIVGSESDLKVSVSAAVHDTAEHRKWPILDLLSLASNVCLNLGLSKEFPLLPRSRIGPLGIKWRTASLPDAVQVDYSPILVAREVAEKLEAECLSGLRFCPTNSVGRRTDKEMVEMVFAGFATHNVTDDEIVVLRSLQLGDDRPARDQGRCPTCGLFPSRPVFEFGAQRLQTADDFFVMRDFGRRYVSARGREEIEHYLPDYFDFEELVPFDPDQFEI
jgi:hypothetical protein